MSERETDFPRARLEHRQGGDFELRLRCRRPIIRNDGSIVIYLDRGDVATLHADCSASLLDDDIERGAVKC